MRGHAGPRYKDKDTSVYSYGHEYGDVSGNTCPVSDTYQADDSKSECNEYILDPVTGIMTHVSNEATAKDADKNQSVEKNVVSDTDLEYAVPESSTSFTEHHTQVEQDTSLSQVERDTSAFVSSGDHTTDVDNDMSPYTASTGLKAHVEKDTNSYIDSTVDIVDLEKDTSLHHAPVSLTENVEKETSLSPTSLVQVEQDTSIHVASTDNTGHIPTSHGHVEEDTSSYHDPVSHRHTEKDTSLYHLPSFTHGHVKQDESTYLSPISHERAEKDASSYRTSGVYHDPSSRGLVEKDTRLYHASASHGHLEKDTSSLDVSLGHNKRHSELDPNMYTGISHDILATKHDSKSSLHRSSVEHNVHDQKAISFPPIEHTTHVPNTSQYLTSIGTKRHVDQDTSSYHTSVGHKRTVEQEPNPYHALIGHKEPTQDTSSYPKPVGYKGATERDTTPYHTQRHKGHIKHGTPYHTPLGFTNPVVQDTTYHTPISHTGHVLPDTSAYPTSSSHTRHIDTGTYHNIGHTGHVEHDTSYHHFGHMGHIPDTMYLPYPEHTGYSFDRDSAFGYMGHSQTQLDTSVTVKQADTTVGSVGHSYDMDTLQAMEQSRHVLESETHTDTTEQEASSTHNMLL